MNNYGYYRPGLPFVVKNLIIINAIVFVATLFAQQFMYQTFSLFYFTSPFFKPFQLITYMFMHGGFWHIFFNMFSLYMFGSVLENYWGGKKSCTCRLLSRKCQVLLKQQSTECLQ